MEAEQNKCIHNVLKSAVAAILEVMVSYQRSLNIKLHLCYEIDDQAHTIAFKHAVTKKTEKVSTDDASKPQEKEIEKTNITDAVIGNAMKQALKVLDEKQAESNDRTTVDILAADIGLDFVRQWDWPEEEDEAEQGEKGNKAKNQCQVCQKSFSFPTNLTRHEKKIHGIQQKAGRMVDVVSVSEEEDSLTKEDQTFKCSVCSREFPLYQNLGRHLMKAHKMRVVDQEMKSGESTPHGKGGYICSLCGHRFTFQSNLSRHFAKVHKRCPKAKRRATRVSTPENKNNRKKTNERARHKCELCPCRFTFRSNLNRHMNKMHRKKTPPKIVQPSNSTETGTKKGTASRVMDYPTTSKVPLKASENHSVSSSSNPIKSPLEPLKPLQTILPTPSPVHPSPLSNQGSPYSYAYISPPYTSPQSTHVPPSLQGLSSPHTPSVHVLTSSDTSFTPSFQNLVSSKISPYTSPSGQAVSYSQSPMYTPLNRSHQSGSDSSSFISPGGPYTPTTIVHVSPYTSPMVHSSPFTPSTHASPSATNPSPIFTPPNPPNKSMNPPKSKKLSTESTSTIIRPFAHSTPSPKQPRSIDSSPESPSLQIDTEERPMSPPRPLIMSDITPPGPLSPLIPPPPMSISFQAPHPLSQTPPPPPTPPSYPRPLPTTHSASIPVPSLSSTTHVLPTHSPSIPIPSLSSTTHCLPTHSPSIPVSSLSTTTHGLPTHSPSIPIPSLSSTTHALPTHSPSIPVPSLSSTTHGLPTHSPTIPVPCLPSASLISLVHNAPISLVHNTPMLQPYPLLPRGCRKFGCTVCGQLFSFEANVKRHFLSQHSTPSKDVAMFREILTAVPLDGSIHMPAVQTSTTTSVSTPITTTPSSPSTTKIVTNVTTKTEESSSTDSKPVIKAASDHKAKDFKSESATKAPVFTPKSTNCKESKREGEVSRSKGKARRFICTVCPATYTFRTNLTRHMRQKHGEEK